MSQANSHSGPEARDKKEASVGGSEVTAWLECHEVGGNEGSVHARLVGSVKGNLWVLLRTCSLFWGQELTRWFNGGGGTCYVSLVT